MIYQPNTFVEVVKPFLSVCFAFIFVRAIMCLKLNPVPPSNYSEPRSHESVVMNSSKEKTIIFPGRVTSKMV